MILVLIFLGNFLNKYRPGITNDQRAENGSDTSSGTGDTDSSGSSSDELGGGVNVALASGGRQLPEIKIYIIYLSFI